MKELVVTFKDSVEEGMTCILAYGQNFEATTPGLTPVKGELI